MKIAVLAGCPGLAEDAGRLLIHRYIALHSQDCFDVMDADASMSPYEMSRRINACDGLMIVAPHTLAGLPFALQSFMRSSVYMLKKGLPAVFFVYTPLNEGKAGVPCMRQLQAWSKKAGLKCNGSFLIGRSTELQRHPESSLKAGWLRPLGQCFMEADEAFRGTVHETETALWSVSGLYKSDCLNYYLAEARHHGVNKDEFKAEARYVHYL